MAKDRILTGPAAKQTPVTVVETALAPTIGEMSDAYKEFVRDGVKVCRMVYAWKINGGPDRDLNDPEIWDRYLAGVFGLVASSVRGMLGQGETYARLLEFQQPKQLENIRQSHLAALSPLRYHDDLLREALTDATASVEDGRRLTAVGLKDVVGRIRAREGLAKQVLGNSERIPCPACSGKGWNYADACPPGAGPLTT